MMKEYRGQVVDVHRPPPRVIRGLDETVTVPRPARVRVRLENGRTLPDLPEPADARLIRGDRVTLHADLSPEGVIESGGGATAVPGPHIELSGLETRSPRSS
jgi:hypothetical protein